MNQQEYYNLHKVEKFYWWFIGRRFIIKNIINKYTSKTTVFRILDYGSGTGGSFPLLNKFGNTVGVDVSATAIELSKQNFPSNKVYLIKNDQSLPFPDNHFDLVTLLDVLEHVKDDIKLLSEIKRYVKPNGNILIAVPAYQFLWSEHDEALEHYRRYNRHQLTKILNSTGWHVSYATYAITFTFPIIVVFRLIKKITAKFSHPENPKTSHVILPPFLNAFFIILLEIEAWFLKYHYLPFGCSVFVLAQPDFEDKQNTQNI